MKLALLTAGTFLLAFSAQAAILDYDFAAGGGTDVGSTFGNMRTFTTGGITVTVTAFSLTANSDTTFQTSNLGLWTGYGLGACNQNEGSNCASPTHQVSNENGTDFVLFQFSAPVTFTGVNIQPYGTYDRDATYFVGNTASNLNLTGDTLASLTALGFGSEVNDPSTVSSQQRTVTITGSTGNSLLFGASMVNDGSIDYFKIADLDVNTINTSSVPEPATFGLIGAALLGLAAMGKRIRS